MKLILLVTIFVEVITNELWSPNKCLSDTDVKDNHSLTLGQKSLLDRLNRQQTIDRSICLKE